MQLSLTQSDISHIGSMRVEGIVHPTTAEIDLKEEIGKARGLERRRGVARCSDSFPGLGRPSLPEVPGADDWPSNSLAVNQRLAPFAAPPLQPPPLLPPLLQLPPLLPLHLRCCIFMSSPLPALRKVKQKTPLGEKPFMGARHSQHAQTYMQTKHLYT